METLKAVFSLVLAFFMSLGQIISPLFANQSKYFEKWDAGQKFETEYCVELEKKPGKDFVVLNFADVQLGDGEMFTSAWELAKADIKAAIEQAQPDLITLTGDNSWGMVGYIELCREIDSYGIPWAPVMGNHDGQNTPSEFWCAYQFTTCKNCLFRFGPKEMGFGNYIINITENDKIIHTLFMMDTHSDADDTEAGAINLGADGEAGYDHLWANQLEWYEWAVNGITASAGETVESSVFFHIPVVEQETYYPEYYDEENDCWKEEYADTCFGVNHEAVCCARGNNGFFDLCKQLGSTKNIIVGHDHVNSSSMVVDGIRLSYGLKCGSGCYWEPEMNGASTLTISSDGTGTFDHIYLNPEVITAEKSFNEIIESGTYTLKLTVTSDGTTVPLTVYSQGEKYATETTVSGIKARFVSDGTKMYLVLPVLKMYIDAGFTEELIGDNALDDAEGIFDSSGDEGREFVKTAAEKINGKTYTVEEYRTGDGTIRYYYMAQDLKRIETIDSENTVTLIEIKSVSSQVNPSVFSLEGCTKLSEEELERLSAEI